MSDYSSKVAVPGRRIASRMIDQRALILDPSADAIQRLNEVGSFVWSLISERRHTPEAMIAAVVSEFEVEQAEAQGDVEAFLDSLVARGLLRFEDQVEGAHQV